MELKQAINIVEYFLGWRRGKNELMVYSQQEISLAIDKILEEAKKNNN